MEPAAVITECPWCNGTGQHVVEHAVFGPEVTECPDCSGSGVIEDAPSRTGATAPPEVSTATATSQSSQDTSRISGSLEI